MRNSQKYRRSYFLPPEDSYNWVKKDHVEKPPIWCSVDLRDGNQALIEPMSLEEKVEFFQLLLDVIVPCIFYRVRYWYISGFRDRVSIYPYDY